MERNTQRTGLINLLALIVVGAAGFAAARITNSLGGQVGIVFLGLGALVAAVSWFQMRLEEAERIEKLEFEELTKSKAGSGLFEATGADVFPAQRSREQFERFFVPGFTYSCFLPKPRVRSSCGAGFHKLRRPFLSISPRWEWHLDCFSCFCSFLEGSPRH